jgi:hypothetical protein
MDKSAVVEPTPLCQEALWRTVQRIDVMVQYMDSPQFPAAFTFTVVGNSIITRDADAEGVVEVWKGRVVILTRPCIAVVTKEEIELYQCAAGGYERGRWIWIDRRIVPSAKKEYYEALELYNKLMYIFRRLTDHISNILNS